MSALGPLVGHSAVAVDVCGAARGPGVLVFGGASADGVTNRLMYGASGCAASAWRELTEVRGTPPSPRYHHSACVVGLRRMVVFGGASADGLFNDVFVLDLESLEWTALACEGDAPVARNLHTAVAVGDKIFVHGGLTTFDAPTGEFDTYVLDTAAARWHRVRTQGPQPGPRGGHAAVLLPAWGDADDALPADRYLLVVGGMDEETTHADAALLDLDAMRWFRAGSAPAEFRARSGHSLTAVAARRELLLVGGMNRGEFFDDAWALRVARGRAGAAEPVALHWRALDDVPPLRARAIGHTLTCASADRLLLLGGVNGDSGVLSTQAWVDVSATRTGDAS